MYFVVFIVGAKTNVVVPHSWIKEIDSHLEHLINNGLNSNVKFDIFWSNNPQAFNNDGIPLGSYQPIAFNTCASQFPNEGWYKGQIKRFKCK